MIKRFALFSRDIRSSRNSRGTRFFRSYRNYSCSINPLNYIFLGMVFLPFLTCKLLIINSLFVYVDFFLYLCSSKIETETCDVTLSHIVVVVKSLML